MKVILNEDVKHLGELGDVKNVAAGYARNYLFPRNLALPYNSQTVTLFESRKAEIEARKEQKRKDSASEKEKLEALTVEISMPAGSNGKLYGAVTNLTLANYFAANGFEIERKRIEIPGLTIKNVGSYEFKVHLYETTVADVKLVVKPQEDPQAKAESKKSSAKPAEKSEAASPAAEEKAESAE
ncbi:MAG: 50S ribosomal protein L9 [Treponema sp.]|nr:50S ribosomal protein L9 [Treponema sp.]